MARLSQIIAIQKDNKTRAEQAAAFAYHQLQRKNPDPLVGMTKVYTPTDENGAQQPSVESRVQYTVEEALRDVSAKTARYLDLLAARERTDQTATANVVIGDKVFLKDVPVLLLLGLERQLDEELVQARKLPTLSPEHNWNPYDNRGVSVSAPIITKSTSKIPRNHVKAPATDKHPAQVEVYFEDTIVGNWETKHYSGAVSVGRKQDIIERLVKLQEAVKQAREEANTTTVTDFKIGDKIFGYIYGAEST